jgi:hypothetical protein
MKLIKNIFLAFLSIFLLIVVFFIALIREAFVLFTKRKKDTKYFFKGVYFGLSYGFYSIALTIDKASALMFPSLWNAVFIEDNRMYNVVYFGSTESIKEKYSISKILGLNYKNGNLSKFGWWFKEFLDLFEFDHVIKSTEY